MKKLGLVTLALLVLVVLASPGIAVGLSKTVEYKLTSGNVVFDGTVHAKTKCNDCHATLFQMKKGGNPATMQDMEAGKSCGSCHNGTKAFSVKNCAKCDKK
jgi:c(7)-type cytochrome triheme protein